MMAKYLVRRLAFLCITAIIIIALLSFDITISDSGSDFDETTQDYTELISFGLVSCRKSKDIRSLEETVVLMKSVLISAIRFNVWNIDFHVFLEHKNDTLYIRKNVMDFVLINPKWNINLFTYSVFDAVPKKYHQKMLFQPKFRCTFVRHFFPSQIPENVDSIIYMDTDTIVTGNIAELWESLHKMKKKQFMGVVPNHKPEERVRYKVYGCFTTPYLKPLGLNAGLMIMNLTKMRAYDWERKMFKTYLRYSRKTIIEDQILLNILTKIDPGIFYEISCRVNVRCSHCEQWFLCKNAKEKGIITVHGASGQFEKSGRFYYLYEAFRKFNISSNDIQIDLINQIQKTPEIVKRKKGFVFDRCNHPVNHLLFKVPHAIK